MLSVQCNSNSRIIAHLFDDKKGNFLFFFHIRLLHSLFELNVQYMTSIRVKEKLFYITHNNGNCTANTEIDLVYKEPSFVNIINIIYFTIFRFH